MRNPDPWQPPGRGGDPEGDSGGEGRGRRGALAGLLIIALLVIGGLLLSHRLRALADVQDCVLSGRANCARDR